MKTRLLSSILLLGVLALTACPTTNPKKNAKKPGTTEKRALADQESTAMDFQAFLGRLRKAAQAHDVNAVASMMTEDFGYRLNPEGSGAGVFEYWDQNNLWVELNAILAEPFTPKETYMVSPPQFADPASQYDGYRAGIRRVNGSWKFAYFVNG
jgi:hypothetical protein